MNQKPVTPLLHGVIDYVFSGIQLGMPPALKLNNQATKTYQAMGAGFLVMNAFTDTPVGIKRTISFKGHQKADAVFLSSLALLALTKFIRKDKKNLGFHLGFLSVAIAHYILTDYKAGSQS